MYRSGPRSAFQLMICAMGFFVFTLARSTCRSSKMSITELLTPRMQRRKYRVGATAYAGALVDKAGALLTGGAPAVH